MEWVKLGKRTEETSLERSNRKKGAQSSSPLAA
jgi:hypothetical protein